MVNADECWLQWKAATECNNYAATANLPNALLSCRPVQSNLPLMPSRSQFPDPVVRGGVATTVGTTWK